MELIYRLMWIFLIYSVCGWFAEVSYAAMRKRKFSNRGMLNGPVCIVYGVAAVLITVGFEELKDNWVFLFVGCASVCTVLEWTVGKLIEKLGKHRWWDYSKHRFNFDGYICLPYSVLWGMLGVVGLRYANPFFFDVYHMVNHNVAHIIVLVLFGVLIVDALGATVALLGVGKSFPQVNEIDSRLGAITLKMRHYIVNHIDKRMAKAYPDRKKMEAVEKDKNVFAYGCSFYKLLFLFFIGSFLGDIVETIFCRITDGVWMSRSSVVWGPFSIVWGLAMVFATLLLFNYRQRSDSFIFCFGTIIGGTYEYFCSVFTEIFFGKVFWDYSDIPFNLGGRVNLLYCFFWGIAAVVWLKKIFPFLSKWIEKIPKKVGYMISWILLIFMLANVTMSAAALVRLDARESGKKAESSVECWLDIHYNNATMKKIYPNAVKAK